MIRSMLSTDEMLDDFTIRLCRSVIERAAEGQTTKQLQGYLGYRRRTAAPGLEKEAVRRVLKALKTNRWGLRDVVEAQQAAAAEHRADERATREARSAFREQLATAEAMIPPNKRGRSRGGRGGGNKKRTTGPRQLPATLA